jgi:arabinogalactan oligomer/maltooligosaccharide transport system substrate-binding protein
MPTKRLAFALSALFFLFALPLAACGGSSGGSSGPVTITYWYTEGTAEAPIITQLISTFQQDNPTIKVNAQLVAFDGAHDKFATAAQNGSAPDVLRSDVGWNTEFAANKYLYDITKYVGAQDKSDYLQAPMAYATWQGKLYGLPQVTDFLVLYYNKKALSDGGITAAPATWGDFDAANKKLTTGGKFGWTFQGGSYFAQPFIFSFGGGLFDTSTNPPTPTINNAGSVNGLDFLKQEMAYANKLDFQNGYTNSMNAFKTGQAAMLINGPWEYSNILSGSAFSDPNNLGIAAVPYDPATGATVQRSPAGGQNYVMYAGTKHPDEAYKFMAFMSSTASQVAIANANKTLPTRQSAYQDSSIQSNAAVKSFAALLPTQKARPIIPAGGQIYAPVTGFDANLQKFLTGQEDAQTAANNIAAGFKKLVS